MAKQFDLSVIFRVVDKASKPIRNVGKSLNNLTKPVRKAIEILKNWEKAFKKSANV